MLYDLLGYYARGPAPRQASTLDGAALFNSLPPSSIIMVLILMFFYTLTSAFFLGISWSEIGRSSGAALAGQKKLLVLGQPAGAAARAAPRPDAGRGGGAVPSSRAADAVFAAYRHSDAGLRSVAVGRPGVQARRLYN